MKAEYDISTTQSRQNPALPLEMKTGSPEAPDCLPLGDLFLISACGDEQ